MYVTLVYNASAAAAGASNVDFAAATDADFSQRNSHYIFTEHYRLLETVVVGASVTRGRYQVPTWNAVGEFTISKVNRSATVPSNPVVEPYWAYPPDIPMNEEFQVQMSNNLGAATEVESVLLQLGTVDWNANLPATSEIPPIIQVRTSFTVTPTANAWSGPQALTFSQTPKGGVYAVVGAMCQGTNSLAYRLVFPRTTLYHGRKLRPGGIVQNAVGDVPVNIWHRSPWLKGVLGYFHTFEPVQCEVFGLTAAATTYQLFLDLIYLGKNAPLYGSPAGA